MTDAEILALIDATPDAAKLAEAGDDAGCAAALSQVSPLVTIDARVTDRDIYWLLPTPDAAEVFLDVLDRVAVGNPVVKRALKWLSPSEGGLNVGDAKVRAMMDMLKDAGVLSAESVATIKAYGEARTHISADDVSRVMAERRPGGRVRGD